jgi:anti-sigma-K factor RskA
VAPSPGLKDRVLAAATGQKAARPAMLSRVFWSAAAVFLFVMLIGNLFRDREYPNEAGVTPGPGAPAVTGRVLWVDHYVKLEVQGLPALPAGKAYQLWQIGPKGPAPVPCSTFALNPKGELMGTDTMKFLIEKDQTFAVTMEPIGGSKTPTLPIFFTAKVN